MPGERIRFKIYVLGIIEKIPGWEDGEKVPFDFKPNEMTVPTQTFEEEKETVEAIIDLSGTAVVVV